MTHAFSELSTKYKRIVLEDALELINESEEERCLSNGTAYVPYTMKSEILLDYVEDWEYEITEDYDEYLKDSGYILQRTDEHTVCFIPDEDVDTVFNAN